MSANLGLVRSIYADWEHGDWSFADWAHPEIEFVLGDWTDAGVSSGLAGMAEGMREFLGAWGDFYTKADEYRDLDSEWVLDAVELAQPSFEAINRDDSDALMSFWGPDPISYTSAGGLGTFEGRRAVHGFFEDWLSSYDDFEVVAVEIVDLGNGVSYAILRQKGRPVGSSSELRFRFASIGLWVVGLAVQVTNYTDVDEARGGAEQLAEERG